jgi:hypothetical protein
MGEQGEATTTFNEEKSLPVKNKIYLTQGNKDMVCLIYIVVYM